MIPRARPALPLLIRNAICREATLNFAFAVAEFVLERFYAGDLMAWRSRDPTKEGSLRKLARHPKLMMSSVSLYRSLAMYEVAERVGVRRSTRISSGHLRAVLPLLPSQQERLLRATEDARWSTQRLEQEVGALLRHDPSVRVPRGGRKRHSRLQIAVRAVTSCTGAVTEFLATDIDEEPSPESVHASLAALRDARDACARMERRLEPFLSMAQADARPPSRSHGVQVEAHGETSAKRGVGRNLGRAARAGVRRSIDRPES